MQPVDRRAGLAVIQARLALRRHLSRGELVEDLHPGRRHVPIAEYHGQEIQSQPTLLHFGAMTRDAMRVEELPELRLEATRFLREGSPGMDRQEGERYHQESGDITGHREWRDPRAEVSTPQGRL